jgi:polar amino acid transport system substrate-binding protein
MLESRIIDDIAPKGVLRAAINVGNTVLAQQTPDGRVSGIAFDLATEFARRTGIPIEFVLFPSARNMFEALGDDRWDMAFLAIDPARAAEIDFTSPYVATEGTYLVLSDSALRTPAELDAPGMRIAVGEASAYDLFLTRNLKHAEIMRSTEGGSRAMINRFIAERLDAAAGVRAWLDDYTAEHAGFRVMDEPFMEISQALGVPKGRQLAVAALNAFIEDAKTSGFVAASLERSGQTAKVPL